MNLGFICITPLILSFTTANMVNEIIDVFFDDGSPVCCIYTSNSFEENFKNSLQKFAVQLWKPDKMDNNTCRGYKNFIIGDDEESSLEIIQDMIIFIPSISKIFIAVSQEPQHLKELLNFSLRKNWDLILFLEKKGEYSGSNKILPIFTSTYSIITPSFDLQLIKNASEVLRCIKNRPRNNPGEIARALNRTLTVATLQNPPYTIVSDDDKVTGVEVELVKMFFKNPIIIKVLSKRDMTKVAVTESPWFDIRRELTETDGGSDIGVCSLWMRRYPYDFTHSMGQQCITFIVKRPTLYSEDTFVFQSLSFSLWALLITLLVLVITSLSIIQSGSLPEEFFPAYDKGRITLDILRSWAGWAMPRAIPQRYNFLRTIYLVWLIFCLIMVTCYNAGLTTSLKYPKLTKEIKHVKEMVQQKVKWMDETDGVATFIASANETSSKSLVDLYERLHNKARRNILLSGGTYGFRVDNLLGGYVRNIEGIKKSVLVDFQILQDCYANVHNVMGLKADSPYKKYLNDRILEGNQHGFSKFWYRKFAGLRRSEAMLNLFSPNSGERQEMLDFKKMKGCFLLLTFGLAIGTAVFVWEIRNYLLIFV